MFDIQFKTDKKMDDNKFMQHVIITTHLIAVKKCA